VSDFPAPRPSVTTTENPYSIPLRTVWPTHFAIHAEAHQEQDDVILLDCTRRIEALEE
jgi:hypothetical protein